jgi:SAM-dependent methyltransferase
VALLFSPSPSPFVPHRPSWRQPLFLHYATLLRALEPHVRALRGKVLDVGCGLQPYRPWMDRAVEYVGLDREGPLSKPDVVGTVDALPFEDRSFDGVLSTQVFEHVADPSRAFRECARVLRAGGRLVLTVPGVWPAHEAPHDYWRFTRYGLERALREAGFDEIDVAPAGGFWASVGQMVNLEIQRGRIARDLVPLINLCAAWLDQRGSSEELALAWVASARRASAGEGLS